MTRFTLTVPAVLNDGRPVRMATVEEIEADLLRIAGGYTLTEGVGAWAGEHRDYREPVRIYTVDTTGAEEIGDALRLLAQWIAITLDQEAVYVTRQEIDTELVSVPRPIAA